MTAQEYLLSFFLGGASASSASGSASWSNTGCRAIVVPLRGHADRLVRWGVIIVAVGFTLGLAIISVPVGAAAFALLGVATGVLFTASLAARAAFSPPGVEAQIFVSMAGIKVAFSSIGTALAGTLLGLGGNTMFAVAAALTLATLAYLFIDRRPQLSR